jgi:LacI family transcriptional regulator
MDVPASLWIAGYDYIEMARWHAYDLTTLRQPLVRMTETAVSLLMNRIRGLDGKWNTVCLSNELVIRSSTGRRAQLQRSLTLKKITPLQETHHATKK